MLSVNAEVIEQLDVSTRHRSALHAVYTADALILRTYKLGEADRIVVFLTRDRGKKRGVAKGARRPRSRYSGALEPLTRGRGGVLRARAARAGPAQLRRAGAVAAVGVDRARRSGTSATSPS